MKVEADSWTVTITREELEQFIREKTGYEFPEIYFDDVAVRDGDIVIDVRPE